MAGREHLFEEPIDRVDTDIESIRKYRQRSQRCDSFNVSVKGDPGYKEEVPAATVFS
jgi:hypothetical protein